MVVRLPKFAGLLTRRVGLGFDLVGELIELIQIDSGPKAERVRHGLRCRVPARLALLAKTGAERSVDHLFERQPKFARAPLQEPGQVIIDGERGAHAK
jgi:hypothetical protein